ncbi:MAG: hypothetical protein WCG28_03260 [bacterium]
MEQKPNANPVEIIESVTQKFIDLTNRYCSLIKSLNDSNLSDFNRDNLIENAKQEVRKIIEGLDIPQKQFFKNARN